MSGILSICGTPIGNLEDITFRVLRTLKEADYIVCEDTRHTLKLLNYFEIDSKGKLISYHEHNKLTKVNYLVSLLNDDKNLALVSDAGMPFICDPGFELVKACYDQDIEVTTIPSATAFVSGLILSAFPSTSFTFIGFLSPNNKKRNAQLEQIEKSPHTLILYEAPHHIKKTLKDLSIINERKVCIVREITKKYEQRLTGTPKELLEHFETTDPKGEMVVIIEPLSAEDIKKEVTNQWENLSIPEHVAMYETQGMTNKEAIKKVCKDRELPKKVVYSAVHID